MVDRFLYSEVRQKLIDAIKVDIVGPFTKEEILDEDPRFEYLAGILYPQTDADDIEVSEQEVDMDVNIDGDNDYTSMPDEEDNEPMIAAKFKQQSSIGLSFYVEKNTSTIHVQLSWGEYIRQTEKYLTKDNEEKTKNTFARQDMSSLVEIELTSFQKSKDLFLVEDSNLRLRVVKIGLSNEYSLITVQLTNKRAKAKSELDTVIFQVQIEAFSNSEQCFVAENVCRNILSTDEFFYEGRPIFGRGRGCAAEWEQVDRKYASKIRTTFVPEYELAGVGANIDGFDKNHFLMSFMAKPANRQETVARLSKLAESYKKWIDETLINNSRMNSTRFKKDIGDDVIKKCKDSLQRIDDGIKLVAENDKVFDAFCFMNNAMALQRSIANFSKKHGKGIACNFGEFVNPKDEKNWFCWRPFQIAFILMNIKSIVDPTCSERNVVDLLYFPTGGGKTEAYLGLIALTIANRRMTKTETNEFNHDGGVTAILRYTLRLLTTQQRDRLTKMVIAAEMERKRQFPKFGSEPISIGFWVGGGVTPNKFEDLKDSLSDPDKCKYNRNLMYKQLLTCPFCGKPLNGENFKIDFDKKNVDIFCSDENCIFYRYNSKMGPMPLPVYLVDEQIYKKCPTIILATVDKFANLPWNISSNALFGRVSGKCSRDGYVAIGEDHPNHRATDTLPSSTVEGVKPFAPPELIVQDELHLITGPLGTIYGAYETMIESLCSYKAGDKLIKPKYIVSTATIKNASEQVRCLYARRKMSQFPSNGFEISDSFFIKEIPLEESPFRKYVGISASGQSMKTTTLRVYSAILQTAFELSKVEKYKDVIDPYYTLIGYFNSIRELGGTVRLLQDDIPKRINRLKKKYGYEKVRYINNRKEITSRISSTQIVERLQELEIPFGNKDCLDTAIATNMIAVGMDVDRLGLMTVMGQPKQNSEYIQATSRIGRQFPGVVFTIYNPYRPRDLSHYENFVGYHAQLYRFVEGTTATPFSARARDRVLHALVIGAIRLNFPQFAENMAAADISQLNDEQKKQIIASITERLSIVKPLAIEDTKNEIELFLGDWTRLAARAKKLTYYVSNKYLEKYSRLMNYYSENCDIGEKATLNSMREVEAAAAMYYYLED